MAINLRKIRGDLNHSDPQIQTFALMSITRLSPQLVDSAEEIQSIYDKLQGLVKSDNPDVVFLARKASNHIDSVFRPYFQELSLKAGPRRTPDEMDREALLSTLSPALDSKYLSALIMRFIEVGRCEDLSALRPYLQHEDERVRANTVEVFTALGGPEHVEWLIDLLSDRNNRVRGNLVLALVRLGHDDVRPYLEEMLCMGMISMRETAVWVLSELSLPFVEELLIKATLDPYSGVKLRAVRALGAHPSRASVDRLKQLMNDIDINVCEAAVESLRRIKQFLVDARSRKQHAAAAAVSSSPVAVQEKTGPVNQVQSEGPAGDAVDPASAGGPAAPGLQDAQGDAELLDPSEAELPGESDDSPDESRAGTRSLPDNTVRDELLREIGTEIYQLCRLNIISHEALDNIFYEILRYQDFLRAYLVKKQQGADSAVSPRSAIEQLQEKIKESFQELARCALNLIDLDRLRIPQEHREVIDEHKERLEQLDDPNGIIGGNSGSQ